MDVKSHNEAIDMAYQLVMTTFRDADSQEDVDIGLLLANINKLKQHIDNDDNYDHDACEYYN